MSKKTGMATTGSAPTANIALIHAVMTNLKDRADGLPGIATFYGPPGLGKSTCAAYVSHPVTFNGVYVACRSIETKKSLTEQICKAIGITPKGSISTMFDQIVEALALGDRPLIVDEVDHVVESRTLEMLRDLHDASQCALLLIGEENLPSKLRRHERFDSRVLIWQPAERCGPKDFDLLAAHYAPGIAIAAELKDRILRESQNITRRVVVNVEIIKRWCAQQATTDAPADCPVHLYNGRAPGRSA